MAWTPVSAVYTTKNKGVDRIHTPKPQRSEAEKEYVLYSKETGLLKKRRGWFPILRGVGVRSG
jgi:hypothetical protein